ncbi:MAG TPA: NAD-dependent protein deacylase [Candidatus Omnitrophota bacterium]|nr:NAD-dependent protein deacylase [Candidatus Omnitrophota bacterium]HPS21062.1 NAD-dependent protein deacylase [Candidatus Omnitrophota bacterium]
MENIKKVAEILTKSKRVLFITGAGVSADSGLPTYRGISGLYNDKNTEDGIPVETALSVVTLRTRPEITWKYIAQIEARCRAATFNKAHEVIAGMDEYFENVTVFTQNIDGFHKAAGSKNIIDIHGDMHRIFCEKCGWKKSIRDFSEIAIPPVCPDCGSLARPDVVFYGEQLPYDKVQKLSKELEKGFDAYFSIGTTSVFPYIQQPIMLARAKGRPTIEINPSDTEVSDIVDIRIRSGAAKAMGEIMKTFLSIKKK